jgi:hypothetical protein
MQVDAYPATSHLFTKGAVPFRLEKLRRYYLFSRDVLSEFYESKGLPQGGIDGRAKNLTAVRATNLKMFLSFSTPLYDDNVVRKEDQYTSTSIFNALPQDKSQVKPEYPSILLVTSLPRVLDCYLPSQQLWGN